MESLVFKVAAVGVAGVARNGSPGVFRAPAIVLLLAAGCCSVPVTGLVDPQTDFHGVFGPMVAIAVAIILFEGGLTLNFAEIQHTSKAVRRLVLIGAPLGRVPRRSRGALYRRAGMGAGRDPGRLFVVTGPTVIMPLLARRAGSKAAALLRWEAIVNDPVGALFAVLAFEIAILAHDGPAGAAHGHSPGGLILLALTALVVALAVGYLLARLVIWLFTAGLAAGVPQIAHPLGLRAGRLRDLAARVGRKRAVDRHGDGRGHRQRESSLVSPSCGASRRPSPHCW